MIIAYILAGAVITGVGVIHLINFILSRHTDEEVEMMTNHGVQLTKVSHYDTESIKNLAKTLQIHKKLGYEETYASGIELLANIVEIIERITVGTDSNEKVSHEAYEALAKYGNMARKVDTLLGESGFLDIQKNPLKWGEKESAEMSLDIIQGIKDCTDSVNEDIIKFNNDKIIDIKVALAAISQDTERRNSKIDNIFNKEIVENIEIEKNTSDEEISQEKLEDEIEYITKDSAQKKTLKNN